MATYRDRHNSIVVTPDPKGKFISGFISGTPKPGTVVQLKAAVEPVSGLYTYEVFNQGTTGDRPGGPILVLCEDDLQGKTIDDAYVSGTRCKMYAPVNGDDLLMLLKDVSGTADTRAIGDLYMVEEDSGKLIVTTGSPQTEPFCLKETLAALSADLLALCTFQG